MEEKIFIASRVMNQDLYNISNNLNSLPFERRVSHPRNGLGHDYIWSILNMQDADWVINVDEDMFVTNPERIMGLIDHMRENEYHFCGISDGGYCVVRGHNPVVMNPFFNIFHVAKIKDKAAECKLQDVMQLQHMEQFEKFCPHHLSQSKIDRNIREAKNMRAQYDNFEPYYPVFFWLLLNNFTPLFIDCIQAFWENPQNNEIDSFTTTIMDHNGDQIGHHTWMGRRWRSNHRGRITNAIRVIYEECGVELPNGIL
jgi:hypothetical protein